MRPVGILLIISIFYSCVNSTRPTPASTSWCDKKPRLGLSRLTEVKTNRPWFRVYRVADSVYAITEPYNYEETISYLILGTRKALLFDTGMGLDSISPVVNQLTQLPVTVLNSHTHFDHIGGNYEFDNILAMNTAFTKKNAANGYSHTEIKSEVAPDAFCLRCLPKTDTAHYRTKPFKISALINDGFMIDLGGRQLQVIATPGHTPDAISLLDNKNGYLWCGDSFYEGPIFLFAQETDLAAYKKSIAKMASLAPGLHSVFPAHNIPVVRFDDLVAANTAFTTVMDGAKKGTPDEANSLSFKFDKFSFLIRKDLVK